MEKVSSDTIEKLSDAAVQQFIVTHADEDPAVFLLRNKPVHGVAPALIADQLAGRRKAKEKLPLYFSSSRILYPPPLHVEQSSSEATARFKAGLARKLVPGDLLSVADLTAGFGVDTYFFSRVSAVTHACETNSPLADIAAHNHHVLGAKNISWYKGDAITFINELRDSLDLIYIDPSRRKKDHTKVHAFEDSEPDIVALQEKIFGKARMMMVKASPLLDIQAGLGVLKFVRAVYVVSVQGECREVLFISEKDFDGIPAIETVNLATGGDQFFGFTFPAEQQLQITYRDPGKYLYEPNASIMKAGAFRSVAARFGLEKIHVNTHLYTADALVSGFPGRIFEVEADVRPEPRAIRIYFPEGKANVTTRNYPLSVEALKKRTGLRDGGEKFLFGFSGQQKKFLMVARRIS